MKFYMAILAAMSLCAFANLDKAPSSFAHGSGKAVFVDFQSALYKISYRVTEEKASVVSTILFNQDEEGAPIFDLIPEVESAAINGEEVEIKAVSDPDGETSYKLVNKILPPGEHKLSLRHSFTRNLEFGSRSAKSGFWMSDLADRKYLEQYLPSNIEYDQYRIQMDVRVEGTESPHEVFTNGSVSKMGTNHFYIVFPDYFTASSLYFHLSKEGRFEKVSFTFSSKNGRIVPIVAYSNYSWNLYNIESKVTKILQELEDKFGAWGHPSLTIYLAGRGGMEHSGATITSLYALGHEITHSYFARGVMPINGNSGWIDEAIASWRDDGYEKRERPFYSSAQMSGFSQYKRTTDRKAYSEGSSFMSYLNHRLEAQGGLRAFLESLYSNYLHQSISTDIFIKELETFSGEKFSAEFGRYVFGRSEEGSKAHSINVNNPYHPRLSEQELLELL